MRRPAAVGIAAHAARRLSGSACAGARGEDAKRLAAELREGARPRREGAHAAHERLGRLGEVESGFFALELRREA